MKRNQITIEKAFDGEDKDAPNVIHLLETVSVTPVEEDVGDRGGVAVAEQVLERTYGMNKLTLTAKVSVVCGSSEAEILTTTLRLNRLIRAALVHELSLWE